MRRNRKWVGLKGLVVAATVLLCLMTGAAFAATQQSVVMRPADATEVPKAVKDAFRAPDRTEIGADSLSSAYAGYIYLTSHGNGGTYSAQQGSSVYVSCTATDYNGWDDYLPLIAVYDTYSGSIVKSYWASEYVSYSYSGYVNIDTSSLAVSTGRYVVHATLWDDYYDEVEDDEYFNLNITSADSVSAYISGVSPSVAAVGTSVSFSGGASDYAGHAISGYEWRSSIDGVLSTRSSFSTSALSVGTHTIYLRALCANGTWSPEVSTTLTVYGHTVTPTIDAAYPTPVTVGQNVTFAGHATDSFGHPATGFQWRSSINGVLSTSSSFSTSALSIGTHTIYFSAQCSNGVWSPEVATTVTVKAPVAGTGLSVAGAKTVRRNHYYTVSGKVSPASAGGRVRIIFKRYYSGKWHTVGSTKYATVKGGKFSYRYKPSKRGSWRAYATYTGQNAWNVVYLSSSTKSKSFKVK